MNISKSDILLKRLKKFSLIYLSLTIICCALYYLICNSIDQAVLDKSTIQQSITSAITNSNNLEAKIRDTKQASNLWRQLNENNKTRNGLKIDQAKILLKNLEKYYYLNKAVDVNLTPPTELSDMYKKETTVVMSSLVTLKFAGVSDELLLGFTDSILKNFPGFISVQSFIMERKEPITIDVTNKAAAGSFENIVEATLVFNWRDFKDLAVETPNDKKN
jgi:hypothetical protein